MRSTKTSEEIDLHRRRFVRAATLSVAAGQLVGMAKAQPPGAAHRSDVDEQGNGTVTQQRLYQLIRQTKPHHRSPVRDRVSQSGRRSLCVQVRLIRAQQAIMEAAQWIRLRPWTISTKIDAASLAPPRWQSPPLSSA